MSRRAWVVLALVGVLVAAVGAVVYYRAGGETTWPFVLLLAFVIVWIPVRHWLRRRAADVAARARDRRT